MSVDTGQQTRIETTPDNIWPALAECARSIADGETTSVAMVGRSLDLIDASQSTLNAFRVVRRAAALAEAAEADRRVTAGERLPLLGVPIAVKDDVDVAGESTEFGAPGTFPTKTADCESVRRLRAAGAVIVGKTHSPEFGQWPLTGGHFGYTRNPWAAGHTPGGSSGGTAAAVAAGLVPAALGSDGAGSVRIPASWTNLVGIKPQRGRISTWPEPEAFHGITVIGPLARTVEDAALLFDLVSGNRDGDLHTPRPVTVSDAVDREPGPLRIALSLRRPFTATPTTLHPELLSAVGSTAHTLRRLGHEVVIADPTYGIMLGANFLPRSMAGLEDWRRRVPDPTLLDPRTLSNARTGRLLGGVPLRVARAVEPLMRRRIGKIFNEFDVILAPTTATPPPPVEAIDGTGHWATDQVITAACPYAWPWNVLGWPAVNVPAGFTAEGLPRGVQLMGHESTEPLLVSLAAQLERELRWHEARPEQWW